MKIINMSFQSDRIAKRKEDTRKIWQWAAILMTSPYKSKVSSLIQRRRNPPITKDKFNERYIEAKR